MTHGLALTRRLIAVAIAMALGVSGSAGDAATPPLAPNFNSTAFQKTRNTVLIDGQDHGLARLSFQALVDQCNGFRKLQYKLGPVSPPDATMASLDVFVHEKYFDTNKALTVITSKGLVLTDMRRWLDQVVAANKAGVGGYPDVPPDCSVFTLAETRSGTLWRDGLRYQLRYETKKAFGQKAPTVPAAPAVITEQFLSRPSIKQAGQTCREVVGVIGFAPGSHACVWDIFPYVSYLNWPFLLSGRVQYGPNAAMFETIETLQADHGHSIAPDVFEIPAGFTVRVVK